MPLELYINDKGEVVFIHDDDLALLLSDLGTINTSRASHVEPDPKNPGKWLADMSPSGVDVVLGPFNTRREALSAETEWLKRHLETKDAKVQSDLGTVARI